MRVRSWILALALAFCWFPAAVFGQQSAIDWDFQAKLESEDRDLIARYQGAAREYGRLSLELAAHFPTPLLELQVRRDLSRLRWRVSGDYRGGLWNEALVCPADRPVLEKIEGVMALGSARRTWIRMQIAGDRLLTLPEWKGRALLLRPDGELVRLMVLAP